MFNVKIIRKEDTEWHEIISDCKVYDFHHSSFYHQIDNDQDCCLFVYGNDSQFIAFPLVIRTISNSEYFDFTSVYGYAGPITNIDCIADEFLESFKGAFELYCKENNIICGFTRLNPLIPNQTTILETIGAVINLNKTVFIDLTKSIDEQRKEFRKSLKSELNQLRRKGYVVKEAKSREEIDAFVDIYYETMDRVEATSYYYFTKEYFYNFLENSEFDSKLLLAYNEDVVTAGAIFTFSSGIMQYHLAGTKDEFIRETPMKLILDEARILGSSLNQKYLHLGGGVGGHDDDSLFRFKSGFSKEFAQFNIWKSIFNQEVYNQLVADKGLKDSDSNYFPLYRI